MLQNVNSVLQAGAFRVGRVDGFKSTLLLLNFAVILRVCEAQDLPVFCLCSAGITIACPHFWL